MDDCSPVRMARLERHLAEVLLEQALLWRLVSLVQRTGHVPCRSDVDAVLADTHPDRPGVGTQRQRVSDRPARPFRADDVPRQP